jgi:uncharacterized lipoprotein
MNLVYRWLAIALALGAVSGCHFLKSRTGCHADQEYRHAQQLAPLKVPAGLDAPNTATALVIPDVRTDIPARGPREACLEEPPQYRPSTPAKPLPQS